MGISKYNSEGYHDPTVYEALSHIEKEEKAARRVYRPLVYICSPYAGDIEQNVNMARVYSRFAVKNTCIPLTPHLLYPQFMDGAGAAYQVRTGVGVRRRYLCWDGSGDCKGRKEKDTSAVFHRGIGGG